MKTKTSLVLAISSIALFFLSSFANATSLQTLRGTKWYLESVTTTDSTSKQSSTKVFEKGLQRISFAKDGKYEAQNLLGLDSLKGFLIEGTHTLVLSNEKATAYFWVFETLTKTSDSLKVRFINYAASNMVMQLTFKPLTSDIETMLLATPSIKVTDFQGVWEWKLEDKSLLISLNQVGKELLGTHCYGVNCKDKYNLLGTVEKDTATVQIKDPVSLEILGVGKLIKLADGSLMWRIEKNEKNKIATIKDVNLQLQPKTKEEDKL